MPTNSNAICKRLVLVLALLPGSYGSATKAFGQDDSVAAHAELPIYRELVLHDGPTAYWSFDESKDSESHVAANLAGPSLGGTLGGKSLSVVAGPRSPMFPKFGGEQNTAIEFQAGSGWIEIADPGESSALDFDNGEAITLEAWVNPAKDIETAGLVYLLGKGRTSRSGEHSINQNYGLRLKTIVSKNQSTRAALSFLFRSRGEEGDWHRWTSRGSFIMGDGWHHVVLTYEFGKPESIRGYIDGKQTPGKWDMGGKTDRPPYLSNDKLWLGTSMEQAPASSLNGAMDEVAIYRKALSAEQIQSHFELKLPELAVDWEGVNDQEILLKIFENIPDDKSWLFRTVDLSDTFRSDWLAFPSIPQKYNNQGLIIDRSNPFLLRALTRGPYSRG